MNLTFWPKYQWAHPQLIESLCMKFHDDRYKGKAILQHKPFSVINAWWPWPLDPEINRAHPRLMGGLCMKFHDDWCKGKAIMRVFMMIGVKGKQLCDKNYFQLSMHCDFDLLTPKSMEHIVDPWRGFIMKILMLKSIINKLWDVSTSTYSFIL